MLADWLPWAIFLGFVLIMLALDLGVFHRDAHEVSRKEALIWSGVWIGLAILFNIGIYLFQGTDAGVEWTTGYLIEKSLSVDNVFVFLLIFSAFAVPAKYQHRVLFWGIVGALAMRAILIAFAGVLLGSLHWMIYVFGAFLILTALKMLFMKTDEKDPTQNFVVRLVKRFFPVTDRFHGEHFLVRAGSDTSHEPPVPGAPVEADAAVDRATPGALMLTPLALALVLVEATDVVFAVDSIPAIFAITADPFLVFTSNVFAILGLRSLYFALAGMIDKFRYLKASLAVVLAMVGGKMLAASWLKAVLGPNFNFYLLGAVLLTLAAGAVASTLANRRQAGIAGAPEVAHETA
jgi:tellurite resistance protein TerC